MEQPFLAVEVNMIWLGTISATPGNVGIGRPGLPRAGVQIELEDFLKPLGHEEDRPLTIDYGKDNAFDPAVVVVGGFTSPFFSIIAEETVVGQNSSNTGLVPRATCPEYMPMPRRSLGGSLRPPAGEVGERTSERINAPKLAMK